MLHSWDAFARAVDQAIESAPTSPLAILHLHLRRQRGLRVLGGQPLLERASAELASRVSAVLRAGDLWMVAGEADLLIALPGLLSPAHARLAGQALLRALETPLQIDGFGLSAQPELGIALYPQQGRSALELQRAASLALAQPRRGETNIQSAALPAPEVLHAELAAALRANQLDVVFQPILHLANGRRSGYEALARWRHPQSGQPVPPAVFVPLAEEAGLAAELTRWSLQAALREFAPLHARDRSLHCALNLSARAFEDSALLEQIAAALSIWALPPQNLLLEITETALLEDPEGCAGQLGRLRALGVRIALDDFGQGYSSFGYLQHLELDTLKIDRRFLQQLEGERDRGLVQTMIELAHRLGMRAVAEGIETEAVHASLLELGCDEAQGWLYGRPAPAAHWLQSAH